MKIQERKTGLMGEVLNIQEKDGKSFYEVLLNGETKTVAESTFKRNYKKIKDEIATTVEVETNELIEMVINPEIIENKEENKNNIELVYKETEIVTIKELVNEIKTIASVITTWDLTVIKDTKNIKIKFGHSRISEIKLDCELNLFDGLVEELKELELKNNVGEKIEVKELNNFKRSNPSAFKARALRVVNIETKEEKIFNKRNDAMIWLEKEFNEGKLEKKPTYYQVKKAIEKNEEYLGYTWVEII